MREDGRRPRGRLRTVCIFGGARYRGESWLGERPVWRCSVWLLLSERVMSRECEEEERAEFECASRTLSPSASATDRRGGGQSGQLQALTSPWLQCCMPACTRGASALLRTSRRSSRRSCSRLIPATYSVPRPAPKRFKRAAHPPEAARQASTIGHRARPHSLARPTAEVTSPSFACASYQVLAALSNALYLTALSFY